MGGLVGLREVLEQQVSMKGGIEEGAHRHGHTRWVDLPGDDKYSGVVD